MVLASFAAAGMGDAYLLPAIASVVLGGASILSVVQMPEAGRQIIYGVVIIAMLLLYGRESRAR